MKSEACDIKVSLEFFLQAPYTHQFLLVFQILSKFSLPGLIKTSVKSPFPYKCQPSSGLSSSLLMKTSCLRLKLVELNFFASFNADDQRKTYVSNVSKYTFQSSRWIFSLELLTMIHMFELYKFIWFLLLTIIIKIQMFQYFMQL